MGNQPQRELKFRVWDEIGEKYVKASEELEVFDNEHVISTEGEVFLWNENESEFGPVSRKVIQQYTGLEDKNGVEIYEGDILKSPYGEVTVVWDEEGLYWDMKNKESGIRTALSFLSRSQVEVIGNIFEGVK